MWDFHSIFLHVWIKLNRQTAQSMRRDIDYIKKKRFAIGDEKWKYRYSVGTIFTLKFKGWKFVLKKS